MKKRTLVGWSFALGVCAAASLPAVRADGPAGGEPVTLQFKDVPGKVHKFRFAIKSDLTMTPDGGGGGGLGALPVGVKSTALFTEKVKSAEADSASLIVTPISLVMDNTIMGMSIGLKMEGGKLTSNG